MSTIYRLISAQEWRAAEQAGAFHGSEHDLRDGYIHFSTAAQVVETAAKFYAGQTDLLLLYVKTTALTDPLQWEVSRNDELFPHLYGALPVVAVHRVEKIELGLHGHVFPELESSGG